MRKICFFNPDSNSNVSFNIFAKFARSGKRVLIIDLRYSKSSKKNELDVGLNIKACIQEKNGLNKYITSLEKNLDVIKGEESLNLEEFGMFKEFFTLDYFNRKFKILETYDYVVLEVSPNLTFLSMNALFFANEVMAVLNLENSGITFAYKLSKFVKSFNRIYENKIFISKFIPSFKESLEKEKLVYLVSNFSSRMISYPLPELKKHEDFKIGLSKIYESILEDEKVLDLMGENKERQKLITEYLEVLPERNSKEY